MRKIATRLEQARRIKEIYQWLMNGDSMQEAIEKSCNLFNIRRAQARHIVNRARKFVTLHFQQQAQDELSDICAKMDYLYTKSKLEEPGTANQILMNKAKILGLVRNNIDLSVNDEREHSNLTDDELETITPTIN